MSLKGFINTNKIRFFFITLLSILSGTSGIMAGYIQMYWLTYIKGNDWIKVGITTGLMALCWFFFSICYLFCSIFKQYSGRRIF